MVLFNSAHVDVTAATPLLRKISEDANALGRVVYGLISDCIFFGDLKMICRLDVEEEINWMLGYVRVLGRRVKTEVVVTVIWIGASAPWNMIGGQITLEAA